MQTSPITRWRLGGFVQRALDPLATDTPVNPTGNSTPEIEEATNLARTHFCLLANEFHKAGRAVELQRHASNVRYHEFARLLLQLALQAWPAFGRAHLWGRERMGMLP